MIDNHAEAPLHRLTILIHESLTLPLVAFASIVADLEVLGSCDAIVGTAASWVSRLIFLLIVGNTGRTPPHVFLDQRFGGPADVW